uniref:Ig-like domain-containing protein n=1 Tax=Sus scrofa TaxID=9823 RepID=A0A8D0MUK0_PIG
MCLSFPPNINTHTPYFSPQFLSLSLKYKLQEWTVICFLLFRFEGAQVGQAQGQSRPGSNRTQRVLLLDRFFYNGEEFVRFHSDLGEYRAVTESKRVEVDRVCRLNYGVLDTFLVPRQTEPTVTVYPAKTQPLQHHNLLVCSVTGFYPGHVEVRWFRNGQEEAAGVVSTGLIPNGDWTFQTMVMLETVPQSGEVYSCRVEHPSLTSPVTVEWRVWSENAQNKMLSGLGGFVLGILFLAVGLFFYFRCQKGEGPVGGRDAPQTFWRKKYSSLDIHGPI